MSPQISSPAPSFPTTKQGWEHLSARAHVDWKLSWFKRLSSSQLQILERHHQPYEIVAVLVGVTMVQGKQRSVRQRLMGWPGQGSLRLCSGIVQTWFECRGNLKAKPQPDCQLASGPGTGLAQVATCTWIPREKASCFDLAQNTLQK